MTGVFTSQIDLAQLLVVAFVVFFFGLVFYLRREDKREGYPLEEAIPTLGHGIVGFPNAPPPKTYNLLDGTTSTLPKDYGRRELAAQPRAYFPGAPLYPDGDPLVSGIGPGSYTLRADKPFVALDGSPHLEPLRVATAYRCVDPDMDPRGRWVMGADGAEAGTCVDLWVDKPGKLLRYLELELAGGAGRRILPIFYANIRRRAPYIRVEAITAAQFAQVPALRNPTLMTAREEDMVNGFYAGGHMYSAPFKDAIL